MATQVVMSGSVMVRRSGHNTGAATQKKCQAAQRRKRLNFTELAPLVCDHGRPYGFLLPKQETTTTGSLPMETASATPWTPWKMDPQRPLDTGQSVGSTTRSTIMRDVSQTQEDSSSTTTKLEQEDVVTEGLTPLTEEGDNGPELLTMSMISDCSMPFLTIEDAGPDGSGELTVVRESLTVANDGPEGLTVVSEGEGDGSDALKEVRREVELSRKRSLRLKAQVDKLQENREGLGWSQHREKVTEEVQSILRLLLPLTESSPVEPSGQENSLDTALVLLQNVARNLALNHTAQTEMMLLNNQLLEAVQKRLELALELETWKVLREIEGGDDVQMILQQQLQSQQQQAAEQAQRKPSRLGLLRRTNRPPIQRPVSTPLTYTPGQVPVSTPVPSPSPTPQCTPVTWRDRLKMGKVGRHGDQDAEQALQASRSTCSSRLEEGFHTIDL
ncbi:unnamed protein product [Coregonus sp. 'balchen']|nr:unnamed protein product [Coregonus sp. 'balchen']